MTEFSHGSEFGTRPEDIEITLEILRALEDHNTRFTQVGMAVDVLGAESESYTQEYTEERVLDETAKMRAWIEDPERIPIAEQQGLERDIMEVTYQDTLAQLGLIFSPVRPNPEQTLPTVKGDEIFGDVRLQLTDGRSFVSFLRNIASEEYDFADFSSCLGLHLLVEFSHLVAHETNDTHVTQLAAHAGDLKDALEALDAEPHITAYLGEIRNHAATDTVYEWWYANNQYLLVPPNVELPFDAPSPSSWHTSMDDGQILGFQWSRVLDIIESVKNKPAAREFYETLAAVTQENLTFAHNDWLLTMEIEHGSDLGYDEGIRKIFLDIQKRLSEIRRSDEAETESE